MKRRVMAILMALVCSLGLLGCESSDKEVVDDGVVATVVMHPLEAKSDGKVQATGTYPEIILSDTYADKYPALKDTIDNYNANWAERQKSIVSQYGFDASNDESSSTEYEDTISAQVVRADDKLFTILSEDYSYSGGAHPNHMTSVCNIDVSTGCYINLSDILIDGDYLPEIIRVKLEEKYPENAEEFDTYYYNNCACEDPFKQYYEDDSYTWTLTDEGLHIYFSPYQIASYAAGDMDAVVPIDEIPGVFQDEYIQKEHQDLDAIIKYDTADPEQVTIADTDGDYTNNTSSNDEDGEEYNDLGEDTESFDFDAYDHPANAKVINNPTWDKYKSNKAAKAADKHISLTETSKETTDWLDTEVWAQKNGFDPVYVCHSDGKYLYAPANGGQYGYEYTVLYVYRENEDNPLYIFDLGELCNGPDEKDNEESSATQYMRWAQIVDDILYVSIGHNGYASEESKSNYMVAIDINSNTVLWRSEPLVSNAGNFQIVDDTIICGYGFTDEPDYLYLLDRFTGDTVEKIKLTTGPDQIEVKGDTLYVATYNTAYTYKITK